MSNQGWIYIGESYRLPGKAWRHAQARCACGFEGEIKVYADGRPEGRGCNGCKGDRMKRHGGCPYRKPSPEYRVWQSMKNRCTNPNDRAWPDYGGRGITVCDRWLHSFDAFLEDMGPRHDGTTIDRVNNDKGYSLDNCRWATRTEQNRNSRNCRPLTFQGRTMLVVEWADELGIPRSALRNRLNSGMSEEEALSTPYHADRSTRAALKRTARRVEYRGESLTIAQWAERTGIPRTTLNMRFADGWSTEDALTRPHRPCKTRRLTRLTIRADQRSVASCCRPFFLPHAGA